MKISTSQMFNRATDRMSTIQSGLSRTQAQLATAKQILSPSDAPDQAAAIQRLRGEVERQDSHLKTLGTARTRFQAEETALVSANNLMIRFRELGLQAANDTLGPGDKKAVAVELRVLRDELLSLSNLRDDSGNYVFSGTRVNTPAFAEGPDGRVVYQGDETQTQVPAGVERKVQYTRSGSDVFARVVRQDESGAAYGVGFFDGLDDFIDAVEGSDGAGVQRGLSETAAMFSNLNLALAQNGSDQSVILSQEQVLEETTLRLKTTLSGIEDLDYTEAVTRMNQQMMALEAAMGSFSKVSKLTLFDYIR